MLGSQRTEQEHFVRPGQWGIASGYFTEKGTKAQEDPWAVGPLLLEEAEGAQ